MEEVGRDRRPREPIEAPRIAVAEVEGRVETQRAAGR
jgi:hypothetical protein